MGVKRLWSGLATGLSARLLVLTVFFVMLSEVLIFVPSVARDRLAYLEDRLDAARLAVFALEATPDNSVSQSLANELLADVGAHGIAVHEEDATLMIDSDMPPTPNATFDLRGVGMFALIRDAVATLLRSDNRILRVLDMSAKEPGVTVELLLDERPLRAEMWAFGRRLFGASLAISLITAALVYLSLQWLLVRPMRRLTLGMIKFREDPADATRVIKPLGRRDELGQAERELAGMQATVHQALAQKERLAALGTAVTKINHDLKNILATMRLLADGIATSAAPELRRVAPGLAAAIDRAVALTTGTLDYTREGAPPLRRSRFALAGLSEEIAEMEFRTGTDRLLVENKVSPLLIAAADRDQLYRVLHNLVQNAAQAGAHRLTLRAAESEAMLVIEIADDGPGLPPKARENLFRPFAGSARPGGTGLGLAIAREVMRAHGGDIALDESTGAGTIFRLTLPRLSA
ncbi:MAG TPA: HAMP domain-containing sensor histidine kinase [Stellaceae bacterium]|nr:HAMP domain-containing sensor histidine kinase [Stellaceae bacterium]